MGLAIAQVPDPTGDGLTPFGTFQNSQTDSVNLANGNLVLHIQIASFPQRGGKLRMDFKLVFNAPSFKMVQDCPPTGGQCTDIWEATGGIPGVAVTGDQWLSLSAETIHIDSLNTRYIWTAATWDGAST